MSKMNELSVDYDAIEAYEESERQKLRAEGAEEFRNEILRLLEEKISTFSLEQEATSDLYTVHEAFKQGLYAATAYILRVTI